MMLRSRFPMLPPSVRLALLALGTSGLQACGPGRDGPDTGPAAVATARALVRPLVVRNGLSLTPGRDASGAPVTPGPTAVVLAHRSSDGTLRVGCLDSEDGAEALVRGPDEAR